MNPASSLGKVAIACLYCHEEFSVYRSIAKTRRYCSRACLAEDYKTRLQGETNPHFRQAYQPRRCQLCQASFYVYQSQQKKYCSRTCADRAKVKAKPLRQAQQLGFSFGDIRVAKPKRRRLECVQCHKIFSSKQWNQQWCITCRYETRQCVICPDSFVVLRRIEKQTCSRRCFRYLRGQQQQGEKSHRWQGGKTTKAQLVRGSLPYTEWRTTVFARDNYTCVLCYTRGGRLAAHHILRFADYPLLALEPSNGVTLCWPCHGSIHGKEHDYVELFSHIVRAACS